MQDAGEGRKIFHVRFGELLICNLNELLVGEAVFVRHASHL
jgi:hypothetical protein